RDTLDDARFSANPLVTGPPHVRFYAGAPLVAADGHPLGTLCVIDRVPRDLSAEQREALTSLGRQTMGQLERRRASGELARTRAQGQDALEALRQSEEFKTRLIESSPDCIKVLDLEGRLLSMNAGGMRTLEICDFAPLVNAQWVDFWKGEDRVAAEAAIRTA